MFAPRSHRRSYGSATGGQSSAESPTLHGTSASAWSFSILATTLEVPVLLLLGVFPALPPPPSLAAGVRIMLGFGLQGGIIRYWAVIALHAVYRAQMNAKSREREAFELKVKASELAQQLATAQLSSLKMQLQPHFLFNTLGAIMVLIQQQKTAQAEAMVEKLGDLLRLTLEDVEAQEVPLGRELEFLRLYLSIEQVRFEDRLRVRIRPTAPSDNLVPHMVLQPIVENAVRHALGQSEEPVTIEVTAVSSNGSLRLIVSDDGPGFLSPMSDRSGIGLANTRNRLARLMARARTWPSSRRRTEACASQSHYPSGQLRPRLRHAIEHPRGG